MSASFLAAANERAGAPASGRQKVDKLSDKVVDTNPYSRLMCAAAPRRAHART